MMIESSPFFTIVMPVYNGEKFIAGAIKSVISQTFPNWELIIVDDGSTDSSVLIAESFCDNRIKIIKQLHSGSAYIARKSAYEVAQGKYIQMLDCDDSLSSDCLQKHFERISATNADCVLPDLHYINKNKEILLKWCPPDFNYSFVLSGIEAFNYAINWKIHGVACVKTKIIKEYNIDSNLLNADELFSRIIFSKCKSVVFDNGVYRYFRNENSTTLSRKNKVRQFETLTTFLYLYEYANKNNFGFNILRKIVCVYGDSLINSVITFYNERKLINMDSREKIYCILKENYCKFITIPKKLLTYKKRYFFTLSFNSFKIFLLNCRFLSFMQTLKSK